MKISIVGTGRLGGLIAYLVADRGLADEIVLVDINKTLADGQVLDLRHAFFQAGNDVKISAGEYPTIKGSGIIIITAGKPRTATMSSRAELLAENAKIIKQICAGVKPFAGGAVLITTTNPVDAINYLVWKETGVDRSRVIGFGGLLDSSRLKAIISEELNVPVSSISAEVIGEHGENMLPLFSRLKIRGKKAALSKEQKDKIRARLLGSAKEVIEKKGATEYGPVSNILRVVDAVARSKKETLLCSCILDGEFGFRDISLGVPAVVGSGGAEKIDNLVLETEESDLMRKAAEKVRADLKQVM